MGEAPRAWLALGLELLLAALASLALRTAKDALAFCLRVEGALGPEGDQALLLSRALQPPGPSCGPQQLLTWLNEGQGAQVDPEPYYPGKGILRSLAALLHWALDPRPLPPAPGAPLERLQGLLGESAVCLLLARAPPVSVWVLARAVGSLLKTDAHFYSGRPLFTYLMT